MGYWCSKCKHLNTLKNTIYKKDADSAIGHSSLRNISVNVMLIYYDKQVLERLRTGFMPVKYSNTFTCIVYLFDGCLSGKWINEITPVQLLLCIYVTYIMEVSWKKSLFAIHCTHHSLIMRFQIPHTVAWSPEFTRGKGHNVSLERDCLDSLHLISLTGPQLLAT